MKDFMKDFMKERLEEVKLMLLFWAASIPSIILLTVLLSASGALHAAPLSSAAPNPTPVVAGVDSQAGITTDGLLQQGVGSGASVVSGHWALTQLFGTIVDDPLNAGRGGVGAQSTVLGAVFYVLNLTLMAVAVLFMSYGVISSVAATAHEGQLLGKKQSTIWTPVRLITGIAGLAPIFGGWSAAQLFAIWFAMLGVGAGNIGWNAAVDFLAQGGNLTLRMPSSQTAEIGDSLFKMQVCREALKADLTTSASISALPGNYTSALAKDGGVLGGNGAPNAIRQYWSDGSCGAIARAHPLSQGSIAQTVGATMIKLPGAGVSSAIGKTGAADTYAQRIAIASGSIAAKIETAFDKMSESLAIEAQKVVAASDPNAQATAGAAYDPAAVNRAILTYENDVQMSIKQGIGSQALSIAGSDVIEAVKARAKEEGFLTAGAYFMSIARAGSSVQDSLSGIAPQVKGRPVQADSPALAGFNTRYAAALNYLSAKDAQARAYDASQAIIANGGTVDSGYMGYFFDKFKSELGCAYQVPLGQCVVAGLVPAGAMQEKNIILVLKEAGDYTVWVSMAASLPVEFARVKLRDISGIDRDGKSVPIAEAGVTGNLANLIQKYIPGGTVMESMVMTAYHMLDIASTAFVIMLGFGLMLSVYLPLVPLIHWVGAVITWLGKVIEGVINASLWAFAHLDTNGEGMGQRTQHGYIFMLNLLLTPLLMVIGLIMALVVMKIVGSFFAATFPLAIADVQAQSMTGFLSIIAFVIIFATVSVMIVTNSCDLIHSIPDSALTWIGGQNAQSLGKKISDHFAGGTGAVVAALQKTGATSTGHHAKPAKETESSSHNKVARSRK